MKNFIIKCVGFFIGVGIALVIEIGILMVLSTLFDVRLTPRGAGWAVLPIALGVAMATHSPKIYSELPQIMKRISSKFNALSRVARISLALPLLWGFIVVVYVSLFEPYGNMSSADYSHMKKVIFFPPFTLGILYLFYKKIIVDPPNK